jgi:ABC-2 type transport system permease protein
MNNYIKSELFRLSKKKLSYVITGILVLLIIALAIILEYFAKNEPDFPYGNSQFYYSNVFSMSSLNLLIVCFLSIYLLGKDRLIIPTSISLGIERRTIFISKFIVTFIHFLAVIFILGMVTYLSGQLIITENNEAVTTNFLISLINLLPILISAFVVCYSLTFIFDNEVVAVVFVFLFYRVLALFIFGFSSVNESFSFIQAYVPASALSEILSDFMNGTVQLNIISWLINLIIAVVLMIIGLKVLEKKDYA